MSTSVWSRPIPANVPLHRGQRVVLVLDQRGPGSRLDTFDELAAHFYAAESQAFRGYIHSALLDALISRTRRDYDYILLVEVGAGRFDITPGATVWEWAQRIADEWSSLVAGAVRVTGIYDATGIEHPDLTPPAPPPSEFRTFFEAVKWAALASLGVVVFGFFWTLLRKAGGE